MMYQREKETDLMVVEEHASLCARVMVMVAGGMVVAPLGDEGVVVAQRAVLSIALQRRKSRDSKGAQDQHANLYPQRRGRSKPHIGRGRS